MKYNVLYTCFRVCVLYVSIWSYPLAANLSRMIKYTHTHTHRNSERKKTDSNNNNNSSKQHPFDFDTHKYGSKWTATNTSTHHTYCEYVKREKKLPVSWNDLKLLMIIHTRIRTHIYTPQFTRIHHTTHTSKSA